MAVMNVAKFERFFRLAASLDVDKGDLRPTAIIAPRSSRSARAPGAATKPASPGGKGWEGRLGDVLTSGHTIAVI